MRQLGEIDTIFLSKLPVLLGLRYFFHGRDYPHTQRSNVSGSYFEHGVRGIVPSRMLLP
jgi:hypothetical protein